MEIVVVGAIDETKAVLCPETDTTLLEGQGSSLTVAPILGNTAVIESLY
jgi:hypothetical protein